MKAATGKTRSAVLSKVKRMMANNRNRRVIAQCPLCGHKLTYKDVKTLWGRATGAVARATDKEDTSAIIVQGIHCEGPLTYEQVKSLWGKATAAMRKTYGAGTGRPKGAFKEGAPRCPCGEMTLKRAQARRHVCTGPAPKKRKHGKA